MTRQEVTDKLRALMRKTSQKQVDWDSVAEQTEIASLGFDSLSILDLIYDIQSAFELEFEAEEVAGVRTVGDMVTFLAGKLGSASGQG
ncbi:MAG: phosphopantetheine-binding protein [bacterium]